MFITGITLIGVGFAGFAVPGSGTTIFYPISWGCIIVGGVITALFILAIFIEILSKIIPSLKKYILRTIIFLLSTTGKIFTYIIKFVIKNAVISIMEEKGKISAENFILADKNGNDQYSDKIFKMDSFKEIEFIVEPNMSNAHWRFGFKFSSTEDFSTSRFSKNFPLLHVTKDAGKTSLKVDYYNEDSIHGGDVFLKNYTNEKFSIKFSRENNLKDYLNFKVYDKNNMQIYGNKFIFGKHKFMQVSTWGDGNAYEFHINQYISY